MKWMLPVAIALAAGLGGCSVYREATSSAPPTNVRWQTVATAADRDRMRDWRKAWDEALPLARQIADLAGVTFDQNSLREVDDRLEQLAPLFFDQAVLVRRFLRGRRFPRQLLELADTLPGQVELITDLFEGAGHAVLFVEESEVLDESLAGCQHAAESSPASGVVETRGGRMAMSTRPLSLESPVMPRGEPLGL